MDWAIYVAFGALVAALLAVTVLWLNEARENQTTKKILMTLDELTVKVERNTTITGSAIVLIQGLAEQLRQIANDPAKILALATQLDAADDSLAAAITANTPAA